MIIQFIIGVQAPALNVLSLLRMIPLIFQRDFDLRPLLDSALRIANAERTDHEQDAVDGLPRRHRDRTACLRRIVNFSQELHTYAWTTPAGVGGRK